MLPASAGMIRHPDYEWLGADGAPRIRGDDPHSKLTLDKHQ